VKADVLKRRDTCVTLRRVRPPDFSGGRFLPSSL
jgi:hypothetical protein